MCNFTPLWRADRPYERSVDDFAGEMDLTGHNNKANAEYF